MEEIYETNFKTKRQLPACNSYDCKHIRRVRQRRKKRNEAKADSVNYNTDGKYTTELTVEKAKFTGLTSDDIKVVYSVLDEEGFNKAFEEASNDEAKVDIEQYYSDIEAKVTDVSVNGDTSMSLSFTDEKAAENVTNYYSVYIDSKNIEAEVEVEFTDYTLTPEVEYVLVSDENIRLTLTLDDGKFAENVSKDNISLSGSFEDMKIESLSSAGKNITMQLTGKLAFHESSGAYLDGVVDIDKDGIVNAYTSTKATVPVQAETARFVSEKINVSGSTVTVPLVLIDVTDIDSLTKDSFSFEKGVKVTDCKKDSDTQVTLTMTVDGAKDKNSAAKILNGQTVKIGDDYEFTASFVSAEFYPVFDYVEEDGDNLKITLELYSNSGTFADKLENDMFSFGYDFEKASVVSVERTGDTTAELIISVPSNGQTSETLNMDGEVIIAAGSLINKWGDATNSESAYKRDYSQENMGKDLSDTDIDSIKKIVGGFGNTKFGTISGIASGASTGFTVVKTLLEMTGVIQSEHAQVMAKLDEISNQIKQVQNTLDKHTTMLQNLQASVYNSSLSSFDTNVSQLNTYCDYISGYFNDANVEKLGVTQPNVNASGAKWTEYNDKLIAAMEKAEKDGNKNFKGFTQKYETLERYYVLVATEVAKANNQNPLYIFDQLCTLTYNFDTSAYTARTAYRVNLQYSLERALSYILLYYNFGANPNNSQCKVNNNLYTSALKQINGRAVDAKPGQETVYFYVLNANVSKIAIPNFVGARCVLGYTDPSYLDNLSECCFLHFNSLDNFTDKEANDFVSRMHGRTARQEFELAGLEILPRDDAASVVLYRGIIYESGYRLAQSKGQSTDPIGIALRARTHKGKSYADIIKWDESKITKDVLTGDGFLFKNAYRCWLVKE